MSRRGRYTLLTLLFASLLLLKLFQGCGGGGGSGGGDAGGSDVSTENWSFTFTGTGSNAHCNLGTFGENYSYTVAISGSLNKTIQESLANQSSKTLRGDGHFSGTETVTAQSSVPAVCTLSPTNVSNVPANLEAFLTDFSSTPVLKIFIRAEGGATLIGCKATSTHTGANISVPADRLELFGTDFSTSGVIHGSWRTVGSGGPGNGNNAQGTFTATKTAGSNNPPAPADPNAQFRLSLVNITKRSGSGNVVSTPAGISCTAADSCNFAESTFTFGTDVAFAVSFNAGTTGITWSGDCSISGSNSSFSVVMDRDQDCNFAFNTATIEEPGSPLPLNTARFGDGSGEISSNPAGINCGTTCQQTYANGTTVQLTATPHTGSRFVKWSGDCLGTSTTTSVEMSNRRNCAAIFELD